MLWVKAMHVISIISWMAGLLYLPRLFVYHTSVEFGSEQDKTFKIMERRLFRAIMTPAMIASWVFGLWLVFGFSAVSFDAVWVYLKLALVLILTFVHFFLGIQIGVFAKGQNRRPERFFRLLNEIPTLIMIAIVVLVIVKPFSDM